MSRGIVSERLNMPVSTILFPQISHLRSVMENFDKGIVDISFRSLLFCKITGSYSYTKNIFTNKKNAYKR